MSTCLSVAIPLEMKRSISGYTCLVGLDCIIININIIIIFIMLMGGCVLHIFVSACSFYTHFTCNLPKKHKHWL